MTAVPAISHSTTATGAPPRVVIVGAGLAGMAAAVALESAGVSVTLVEARRELGGRATSFEDPKTGEVLDNCQHVLLGCCTNLIDFYRRLGVLHHIDYQRTVHFMDESGRRFDLFGIRGLPAPLHLGPSMLRFGALTWGERIAASRAMMAMLRLGKAGRLALADVPFGQWLDEHRQPASLVRKLYDTILIGSLNEDPRNASAAYAIQVFQDAMLAHANGYVIGLPNCPLAELYRTLPCRDVRLGTRVASLKFSGTSVTGVELSNGEVLSADWVVLATNYHAVQRWIPPELASRDARFANLDKLESVPILGAHLFFDRPVLKESHVAFLSGPLQWLFRKDAAGTAVHGVISAAREWVDVPREEALAQFEKQVRSTLPMAREAKLLRGVTVIEKRATFAPLPGVDRLRPTQAAPEGGLENLVLAGDYTLSGWPAMMEGAVRSGYLAADEIMSRVTTPNASASSPRASFLVPDLPVQWTARLLGHREIH
ncbi:MAG TPA: hydroxysqualene dehydroxylase HpnE [Tepidisphaeraceae bacterium]|nr:hydroxysqualene dehydroxylase HpnE [Tepidisphaeraceae bacterium]